MKKQRIGIEPLDVDLNIQSQPTTAAEEAEFAAYIAQRKKHYAARLASATRRARTTGQAA